MVKKALLVACTIFIGCALNQPMLLNGTSLKLGCYIPWNGNMYGLEVMSYMSGTLVVAPTNGISAIEHSSSSTNSWMFGTLETYESSDTKVKIKEY